MQMIDEHIKDCFRVEYGKDVEWARHNAKEQRIIFSKDQIICRIDAHTPREPRIFYLIFFASWIDRRLNQARKIGSSKQNSLWA